MKLDLTNQPFGKLTAKEIVGKDKRGYLWRCECECGGKKVVPASYLRNGHTQSCGCIIKNIKENSIKKGDRWGMLEADKFVRYDTPERGYQAIWLFKCDCGNPKEMPVANVKFGNVRSCGCKATEHISNLNKEDITGETFDRLTADHPTDKRDVTGSIIWVFRCECGNTIELSVGAFRKGVYHSCGCLYKESRKDCTSYRKDFVDSTSISKIVAAKKPIATNSSGHTGVWFNKRRGLWEAYIDYQKKRYRLGSHKDINDAIRARKEAERRLHDPVVLEHFQNLTPERKKEFIEYMKSIGIAVESGIADEQK